MSSLRISARYPPQSPGSRPTTAASSTRRLRARSGGPPPGTGTVREEKDDDADSVDDDPGMFSFLAPADEASSPTPDQQPVQHPPPSHASSNAYYVNRLDSQHSPAAAFALASIHQSTHEMLNDRQYTGQRSSLSAGMRRREASNDTEDSVNKEDYELKGDTREDWGDDAGSGWGIDATGMRLDGIEMKDRGFHLPTRSEDEKMIEEFDALNAREGNTYAGDYVDDEEDSPYPEVRASVSNYDDPDMPVLTFRAWFLGLFFASLVGGLNAFFMFRYPSPNITPILVQVVSFPFGKLFAWLLPENSWRTPYFFRRLGMSDRWSLNPGPFNIKEHTVIVIMTNAAASPAFALNFSVASAHFYGVNPGITFDFMLVFSTCMIGFGVAGLCRRFLVWPASLIWPQNLVLCTLLNTLHAEEDDDEPGSGVSRYAFFKWSAIGAFSWYFLPDNIVVNQLFGLSSGLGMSMITFDWSQISYIGNPLVVPWWAEVNIFVGFFFAFWVFSPILYYTNTWNSAYLPISSSDVYDRFGQVYDASRVVDNLTGRLNATAYHEYSPLYLPITFAAFYAIAFASATALITHTAIYHGKEIYDRIKNLRKEEEDIHLKLMKVYPEVPEWWYLLYLSVFIALSIVVVVVRALHLRSANRLLIFIFFSLQRWDTQTPVWAVIVALLLGAIYTLPGGFIFAMTSQEITLNLLVDLMGGYMLPGLPVANMMFKTFAVQPIGFALTFVQDLKLGHYMKVPPRATFVAQIAATLFSCVTQVGIKELLVKGFPDLCDPHQSSLLICPTATVLYSASVVWGLIGPRRQFGIGVMYNPILWAMAIGAILPFPFWFLSRRYPKHWVSQVNIPVLLTGATFMPPATGINYSSWITFGFIFQFWSRRRHFRWWSKYNFSLAAALDCGTVLSAIVIFCALQLPKQGAINVNWWGNNVFTDTADWAGTPYLVAPPEGFGPSTWI
ncbi:hypothetical protein P7C70_g2476, partial [Phenoliferia sp. Uapishka_3]